MSATSWRARETRTPPHVIGLIAELPMRRRVFLPISRVVSIDADAVALGTGTISLRRFERRTGELLVLEDLLDRQVTIVETGASATVVDLAMEADRSGEWTLTRVAVREHTGRLTRRGHLHQLDWDEVSGLVGAPAGPGHGRRCWRCWRTCARPTWPTCCRTCRTRGATRSPRRWTTSAWPTCWVSCPSTTRSRSSPRWTGTGPPTCWRRWTRTTRPTCWPSCRSRTGRSCSSLMEPDEASPVRALLAYQPGTAGSVMTSEPVVLTPDATVAEALARVREPQLHPAVAAQVFVARAPMATPTGRYLGMVHFQQLLREPPASMLGGIVDKGIDPLAPSTPLAEVTQRMATYNLVGIAVVDDMDRLVGAVTVDDVLDHLLPRDWRDRDRATGRAAVADIRRDQRLDQPRDPRLRLPRFDPEAFGRWSEAIARYMGTARFIVYMTAFIVVWFAWNTLAPQSWRFDPYTFTFLTLVLSLQASYAAPLILLAQNRQADRDRLALEEDRRRAAMQKADTEFLARELAALRIALGEVATRDFLRSELNRLTEELDDAADRRFKAARKQQRRLARREDQIDLPDGIPGDLPVDLPIELIDDGTGNFERYEPDERPPRRPPLKQPAKDKGAPGTQKAPRASRG